MHLFFLFEPGRTIELSTVRMLTHMESLAKYLYSQQLKMLMSVKMSFITILLGQATQGRSAAHG